MKRTSFFAGFIVVLCLCLASSAFAAADGWASMNGGTTGGQGGTVVDVNNFAAFTYYVNTVGTTPYIIQISGTIGIGTGENSRIRANKTLRGIGVNPTLIGNVRFENDEGNIIIERLNISNPNEVGEKDGISVKQNLNNIFITKCTFYDSGDGNLDITNNSDYVTVSWCKFYYTYNTGHNFVNLIGASDKQDDDANNLRITMHHNWWTTLCKERMPRVRYGQVHVYNNYYSDLMAGGYCIGVGCGSRIRVESNYFNAVPDPWKKYDQDANYPAGTIGWNTGNIYYNCTEPTWATNNYATIFTPPYDDYTLDDANDIPALVQYGAGADGKDDGNPPHWFYGPYGDFDRSGIVDANDLKQFVEEYWLVTDCNAITDADYYPDCIVNFREFAKLAENWLQ